MISLETTARQRPRGEVENLRQPVGVVHLWWLLLGLFTMLIMLVPGLRVTFHHETLSFTLETFNALVATMVSFVALARYVFERRPFDLAIAAAFGTIAVASLWFGLILPFGGYTYQSVTDAPLWGWMLTRLIAVILLLLGLQGWEPGRRLLARAGGRIGVVVGVAALLDIAVWRWNGALPRLVGPGAWALFSSSGRLTVPMLAGQTTLGILIESLVAVLFFWLAYRLTLAVHLGEDAWLALAMIAAAVAQFQLIFHPAPFHPAVTMSDLLWLVAYVLLLGRLGHQYIQASSGMRRQQTRTRALLALSQTPVVDRDPSLVVAAAREAARVVVQEAAVTVRLGAVVEQGVSVCGNRLIVPIALDGVSYGTLDVDPSDSGGLDPDTERYLRVVASQTATLLRAIDLYHELARVAIREERAQLARELHDGLAQDLAVLRLRLGGEHEGSDELALAERALAEARYAITILRGQTAALSDFIEALRRQADDLSDRFACLITIEQAGSMVKISGAVQVALLRICREAIVNAGKHGKPSRIVVSLRQLDDEIEMEIVDDGPGFDPSAPARPGAFGLKGMAERAALRGGRFEVRSSPGAGTSVRVRLPNIEQAAVP